MTSRPELLMDFDISILENEYKRLEEAGETRSAVVETKNDRLRLAIAREFVEFVREHVSAEFGLGLLVEVDHVNKEGIFGRIDFREERLSMLADVEAQVHLARGTLPKLCREGHPILDRLLSCMEVMRAPDRLDEELGELKKECIVSFSTSGWLANSGERADTPEGYSFGVSRQHP